MSEKLHEQITVFIFTKVIKTDERKSIKSGKNSVNKN